MPVERNSHSGVWMSRRGRGSPRAASSADARSFLSPAPGSVQPAMAVNSPADNVVGMAMERTVGGLTRGRPVLPSALVRARKLSSCAGSVTSLPRHSPTIFAASVTEPPPTVSSASAFDRTRGVGGGDHVDARRMRADLRADAGELVAEDAAARRRSRRSRARACRWQDIDRVGAEYARPPAPAPRRVGCRRSPAPSAGSGGCPGS